MIGARRASARWTLGALVTAGAVVGALQLSTRAGGLLPAKSLGPPTARSRTWARATGSVGARARAHAPSPFEVVGELPAAGDASVDGAAAIVVRLSHSLGPMRTPPRVTPEVPGRWYVLRNELVFRPRGAFLPGTRVTVSVLAGPSGPHDRGGQPLRRRFGWSYTVGTGTLLGAEQMLATLGYLPARFHPDGTAPLGRFAREREVFLPLRGRWAFDWPAPAPLRAQWAPGRPSPVATGALMAFQSVAALPMTGALDPQTWAALLRAVAAPGTRGNPNGYSYALVEKSSPETLTVWNDGRVLLETPANTGITAAPTADGTFPVYERLATQVMRGVNPDGVPYADPVAWVAYFNGGDAVHYIARASYGWPQSLGCVELPWAAAEKVWPYLTYGTLVTVAG